MFSIALTVAGTVVIFFGMIMIMDFFGGSTAWAILPIIVALLVASYLRTRYWIQETYTWRSRLIPLAPVFATILVILIAFPFVRLYSVPYVSWEQIEAYLDQVDIHERLSPEERSTLLRYVAENNALPPNFRLAECPYLIQSILFDDSATVRPRLLGEMDRFAAQTFEERLMQTYAEFYKRMTDGRWSRSDRGRFESFLRNLPWETQRRYRLLRIQMVHALVEVAGLQDDRASSVRDWYVRQTHLTVGYVDSELMLSPWRWERNSTRLWMEVQCQMRLELAFAAINAWLNEHGTLPESLDDLISGNLLSELPVHPLTGEPVQYFLNVQLPDEFLDERIVWHAYLGGTGSSTVYRTQSLVEAERQRQLELPAHRRQPVEEQRQTDIFLILGGHGYAIFEQEEGEEEP